MKPKAGETPLHPCPQCKQPTENRCYCDKCLSFIRKVPVGKKSVKDYISGRISR